MFWGFASYTLYANDLPEITDHPQKNFKKFSDGRFRAVGSNKNASFADIPVNGAFSVFRRRAILRRSGAFFCFGVCFIAEHVKTISGAFPWLSVGFGRVAGVAIA